MAQLFLLHMVSYTGILVVSEGTWFESILTFGRFQYFVLDFQKLTTLEKKTFKRKKFKIFHKIQKT